MRRGVPRIHQSVTELKPLLKSEKDVRKWQRVQRLDMLRTGQAKTRQEAATLLGVHRHTGGAWLSGYEEGGLEVLCRIKTAPGKRPRYTPQVLAALQERLASPEGFCSYGQIHRYLEEEPGVRLSYSRVHELVRYGLKAKPKTPRPSAKKKDPVQVKAFVDTFGQQGDGMRQEVAPRILPYRGIRLLSSDESRCGLLPLHRHRVTLKGVQPIASILYQVEVLYLDGAVEPTPGERFLLELPGIDVLHTKS